MGSQLAHKILSQKSVIFTIFWQFSTPTMVKKLRSFFAFFSWNYQRSLKLFVLYEKFVSLCICDYILKNVCPKNHLNWVWKSAIIDHTRNQGQKCFKDIDRKLNQFPKTFYFFKEPLDLVELCLFLNTEWLFIVQNWTISRCKSCTKETWIPNQHSSFLELL